MSTPRPYGNAARAYEAAGYWPLPLPPRKKSSPPEGYTGRNGRQPGPGDVDRWITEHRSGNIGLRLPRGVAGIDVDAYKDEQHVAAWEELAARCGPLPEAPWCSSRADGISGVRLFAVPEDWEAAGKLPEGSNGVSPGEVIQWHHRYVVCPPSIHPDTGRTYRWRAGSITKVADLPALPRSWLDALAASAAPAEQPSRPAPARQADGYAGLRPGDDFNERANWLGDILGPHGWTLHHESSGTLYVTRPGKNTRDGHSATIGHSGDGVARLYVFSADAAPFEMEKPYDKFAAWALLNHGGNHKAAARALGELGYGSQQRAAAPGGEVRRPELHAEEQANSEAAPEGRGQAKPQDVLAPIRAVESLDEDKRKAEVLRAVQGLAQAGQLDDEVTKLTVKDYICRNRLLKAGEFNAVTREVSAARRAAAKNAQQDDGQPDEDEIAAAFLALGGELAGAEVLDRVAAFTGPYLALPSEHCLTVMVLWAAHTHAVHKFYVSPRLIIDSAVFGSGKTRLLELLELVCWRPEMTLNVSTAALYRLIAKAGDRSMTVLFDETDAMFNPRTAPQYEDLRGVLNAGYKRGATVPRCVGDGASMDVKRFPVFAPVALAGIAGHIPHSLIDRACAEIHMRKRLPAETVRSFDQEEAEAEAEPVRVSLAGWIQTVGDSLVSRPAMPDGVTDRPAENWRALLAIADAAAGDWPARARAACVHFVLGLDHHETFGVRLLRDLRTVFTIWETIPADDEDSEPVRVPVGFHDKLHTADILAMLVGPEDSPWANLKGKPLDANKLREELERFDVDKKQVRAPDFSKSPDLEGGYPVTSAKGYYVTGEGGLGDAWARYLPDHETYVHSDLRGNSGNEGNSPGCGSSPHEGRGNTPGTEVTAAEPVTSATPLTCGVTPESSGVTSAASDSEPLTCGVTPVTSVPAKAGTHSSEAVALLKRELGAQPVNAGANGRRQSGQQHTCADCGKPCMRSLAGPDLCDACREAQRAALRAQRLESGDESACRRCGGVLVIDQDGQALACMHCQERYPLAHAKEDQAGKAPGGVLALLQGAELTGDGHGSNGTHHSARGCPDCGDPDDSNFHAANCPGRHPAA